MGVLRGCYYYIDGFFNYEEWVFLWIFGIVLKKMIKFDSYEIIIELFCGNVFYEKLKILMIGKFLVDDYC